MTLMRAPVVWKMESGRVIIMTRKGIYLLNREASEIWQSLDGMQEFENHHIVDDLISEGLLERADD